MTFFLLYISVGTSYCFSIFLIYLFLAVLGLRCCLGASPVVSCRLLTVVASPVEAEGL